MKVILFGSTGMVGQAVLRECLREPEVSEVLAVVRSASGQRHAKLREIVHEDFSDFSTLRLDADACFWCIGVSVAGMTETDYTRITHDYTIAAAKALARPTMTFIFVSAAGAQGNALWARVKRRTEEELAAMPFKAVYVFRPALIQPLHGIKSRTGIYNVIYPLIYPLVVVAKAMNAGFVTDTERIGRAMLNIARKGFAKKVLDTSDINAAAVD